MTSLKPVVQKKSGVVCISSANPLLQEGRVTRKLSSMTGQEHGAVVDNGF